MKIWNDIETRCVTPLKHGTWIYAEKAEVTLYAFAIDDDPVEVWDKLGGEPMPKDLADVSRDPTAEMWFHNVNFDRTVLRFAMPEFFQSIAWERWRCTMVQAYSHGLPGALGTLTDVYGLDDTIGKDKAGNALMHFFCKPNKDGVFNEPKDFPEKWAAFKRYAGRDITSMRALHDKMPKWNYPNNPRELALWHRDGLMNARGIQMDTDLAEAAIAAVNREKAAHNARTVEMTDEELASTTQRDALLKFILAEHGVELPDLKKSTLERRLSDPDLPRELRELIAIRLEVTTTSTSKYATLMKGVSSDGRLRGATQFNGAARTGRDAHRLFQPGNMPRPKVDLMARDLGREKLGDDGAEIYVGLGVEALKSGSADMLFSNVMGLCSNVIRSSIIVPPGKKLVVADLANIEGRGLAGNAGEQWKLDAFAQYDAGTGPDLYKIAYARAFLAAIENVDKEMRQLGKVMELALGYAGGVGAFVTMAMTYMMDLPTVARAVYSTRHDSPVIAERFKEAENFYEWAVKQKRTLGLPKEIFVACDVLKRGWRAAHPATVQFWADIEAAVRAAISQPGRTFKVQKLFVRRDGTWLRIQLPSGRSLCYLKPSVDDSGQITYVGVNPYSKKWGRVKTYGGKVTENITQAWARDALFYNLPKIEEEGFSLLLKIHDELLTEAPDLPEYNEHRLSGLMAHNVKGTENVPLAAEGFSGYRYRKG